LTENLVLDDGGVVVDVDLLDGDSWHFRDHDTSDGIGDGRVDSDEIELAGGVGDGVDLDLEVLLAERREEGRSASSNEKSSTSASAKATTSTARLLQSRRVSQTPQL